MWSLRSPDWIHATYIYVRTPQKKSLHNPPFLPEIQDNIQTVITTISRQKLHHITKYIRCDACLQALDYHWTILLKIIQNEGVKQTLTFLTDTGFFKPQCYHNSCFTQIHSKNTHCIYKIVQNATKTINRTYKHKEL